MLNSWFSPLPFFRVWCFSWPFCTQVRTFVNITTSIREFLHQHVITAFTWSLQHPSTEMWPPPPSSVHPLTPRPLLVSQGIYVSISFKGCFGCSVQRRGENRVHFELPQKLETTFQLVLTCQPMPYLRVSISFMPLWHTAFTSILSYHQR